MSPTINLRVIRYAGKNWVLHSSSVIAGRGKAMITLRLVDGDDVTFADMDRADYDKLVEEVLPKPFYLVPPPVTKAEVMTAKFTAKPVPRVDTKRLRPILRKA